ncbi:hypothetical protein, partial [Variovorax beijingensis]|uniref:hypothetical protein n=1 Tax=Variovorax beijingensis TaxID=2496117 RepID=UPI003F69E413
PLAEAKRLVDASFELVGSGKAGKLGNRHKKRSIQGLKRSGATHYVPYKRVHKEVHAARFVACDRRRIPHY